MEKIIDYLSQSSRNKIVIHKNAVLDVKSFDIGKMLSDTLKDLDEDKRFVMKVLHILDDLILNSIDSHPNYGRYLSIYNMGILFEPRLKIDFIQFVQKHSATNALFIKWDGQIEDSNIYFLNKQSGIKLNFKNISHITI